MKLDVLLPFLGGDQVVHPAHGVGIIKTFSKQLFFGDQTQSYYLFTFLKTTVWIPIPALCETVRYLTAHSQQKPLGIIESELLNKTVLRQHSGDNSKEGLN
jgi:RNA polymerase-interacting CarD/CdnL/TRCF family regulator